MTLKAIGYKLIILPDAVEEKTKSGIVLAVDQKLERGAQVTGTILDMGEDVAAAYKPKTEFWGLKVGDKVWYAKYAGKWIKDIENDREVLVINDEDVCVKEVPNHASAS
jgi:co-chaperonin GroES (HSP10)